MTVSTKKTDICIGVPIYNGDKFLREAMDRLLVQTFADFRIVALNDGSVDNSDAVMREYTALDKRIDYYSLQQRSGLIAAWRRTAELADDLYRPTYFAWYSDHDLVDQNWLETLYEGIRHQPNVVLIHPKTLHIDAEGRPIEVQSVEFDTTGMPIWKRLGEATLSPLGAGDAVYGMFRFDAMKKCGIFRNEILPDKLLVSEINLYGEVKYTPGTTRYRRHTRTMSDQRNTIQAQLSTLFPEGYVNGSPLISYATCFLRSALASEEKSTPEFRAQRIYHAFMFYLASMQKLKETYAQEIDSEEDLEGMSFLKELVISNVQQPTLVTWPEYASAVDKNRKLKLRLDKEYQEIIGRLQQDKDNLKKKLLQEKEELKKQLSVALSKVPLQTEKMKSS